MPRPHWTSDRWGGKRVGAGRPTEDPTRKVTITLPESLVARVDKRAHRESKSRSATLAVLLDKAL